MTRFHGQLALRLEDAAGWRTVTGGALAWFVYAPGREPFAAAWLAGVPGPWPADPGALLEHLGAAARGVRVATGTAVAWSGDDLEVAWLGDVRAVLVRGGRSVATTTDHTLARELGLPEDHELARITRRGLGDDPPERARWATRPGDVLLLCAPHLHDFRPEADWLAEALGPGAVPRGRLLLRAD